jgi:phage shock protein A
VQIGEAATGVGEEMADIGLAIQRAEDKTESMQARAAAVDELERAGTFEDLTQLEPNSDIDRELAKLQAGSQVQSELEKMKAEVGAPKATAALEEGKQDLEAEKP